MAMSRTVKPRDVSREIKQSLKDCESWNTFADELTNKGFSLSASSDQRTLYFSKEGVSFSENDLARGIEYEAFTKQFGSTYHHYKGFPEPKRAEETKVLTRLSRTVPSMVGALIIPLIVLSYEGLFEGLDVSKWVLCSVFYAASLAAQLGKEVARSWTVVGCVALSLAYPYAKEPPEGFPNPEMFFLVQSVLVIAACMVMHVADSRGTNPK